MLWRWPMKAGASDAEAVAREGDEFSVNVRMGEVETLKESGSRGLGLRVFLGKRIRLGVDQRFDGGGNSAACGRRAGAGEGDGGRSVRRAAGSGRVWRRPTAILHLYYDDVYSLQRAGADRVGAAG